MAIIRNEPIGVYHDNAALSKSKLMDYIKRGPRYYEAVWIKKTEPRKESKALWIGNRFDGLCDNADRELATWAPEIPDNAPKRSPEKHRTAAKPSQSTLDAFKWWDEWDAKYADKITVSNEDRFVLQQMLAEFRANPLVGRMWERCERQVTIRCELPGYGWWAITDKKGVVILSPTGMSELAMLEWLANKTKWTFATPPPDRDMLPDAFLEWIKEELATEFAWRWNKIELQARPDGVILDPKAPEMADVKSTRSLATFDRDFFAFGYHCQAAIGQWLLAIEGYDVSERTTFPVVESCRYPRCEVRKAPEGALAHGWSVVKKAVEEIAARIKTNNWREDAQVEVKEINVPNWMAVSWENEE